MFENLIWSYVQGYFERLVSNFNPNDLKVSLWRGDVSLSNVEFERGGCDSIEPACACTTRASALGMCIYEWIACIDIFAVLCSCGG